MILYTVDRGEYLTMEESLHRQPVGQRSLYVNLTNRCTCACTFCLRQLKKMDESMTLWLANEPSVAEVEAAMDDIPWKYVREVVFCGFGEPTMRLADVVTLLRYVKKMQPQMHTRLNTNGLSDLAFGRKTARDFAGGGTRYHIHQSQCFDAGTISGTHAQLFRSCVTGGFAGFCQRLPAIYTTGCADSGRSGRRPG